MTRIAGISHSQDTDGLVCAALLKIAKKVNCVLTDYPDLFDQLRKIDKGVDTIYICDLGLGVNYTSVLRQLSDFSKVVYIDHHPLNNETLETLKKIGITIVHSTNRCAGMLTYQLFKKELPHEASLLAAYAALTDYPTSNRTILNLIKGNHLDSYLITFESSLLYYSIARAFNNIHFKKKLVDGLSELRYPHEIEDVIHYAAEQVKYITSLQRNPNNAISYGKNLAHIQVSGTTSVVANVLVDVLEKPTVICYAKYRNGKQYNLSIRSRESRHNLGLMTSELATKLDGSGGGHPSAAGAQLPSENLLEFINILDGMLN